MKRFLFLIIALTISIPALAQTYTVERVIDGDTIVVTTPEGKSEEVQLIGIDAPESEPNDKARSDAERIGKSIEFINKMGKEATVMMNALAGPRRLVRLKFDVQERDKDGRLLAYVFSEWHPDEVEKFDENEGNIISKNGLYYLIVNGKKWEKKKRKHYW